MQHVAVVHQNTRIVVESGPCIVAVSLQMDTTGEDLHSVVCLKLRVPREVVILLVASHST